MKNIVIIGGTGFIGSHIYKKLQQKGDNVYIVTRQKIQSKEKNIHFVQGDLQDGSSFKRLASRLPQSFYLIDVAALIPTPGKNVTAEEYIDANVHSHVQFFEFFTERIQKVIYISTVDVYGRMKGNSFQEKNVCEPLTPYGLSKLLLEEYYLFAQRILNIPVTIFRLSQVYGPGAHPFNALPKFLDLAVQGETITVFGKGEEKRTYVHVHDVVQAVLLAVQKKKTGIYNVAGTETCSLRQLLNMVQKQSPQPVKIIFAKRQKLLQHQKMSIAKIQRELGFRPLISLEQGIHDYFTVC